MTTIPIEERVPRTHQCSLSTCKRCTYFVRLTDLMAHVKARNAVRGAR